MNIILCSVDGNDDSEVSNYYPLTKDEIAMLLDEAKTVYMIAMDDEVDNATNSKNAARTSGIQERLCQGVPGSMVPLDIEGPVFDKHNEIGALYLKNLRNGNGSNPALVDQLYAIMTR